jgi:hypothetical protein
MIGWIVLAIVLVAARATAGTDRPTNRPEDRPVEPLPDPEPEGGLSEALAAAGVTGDLAIFFRAVAYTESRGRRTARNTTASEAKAALKGYTRLAQQGPLPFPADRYTWGSGGWFGLLPSSAVSGARDMDPLEAVFGERDHTQPIRAAIRYARRLQGWNQWKASPRDWATLRRGWALPTKMHKKLPATDARFLAALKAIGAPAGFEKRKAVIP